MKVIDGKGIAMGRIASHVAKELLKGAEIAVINCNEAIITGNKKTIKEEFWIERQRVGTIQKGPKILRSSDRIVKRAIRGMLPEHRFGRGRDAWKRVKCYVGMPKELEGQKIESLKKTKKLKSIEVQELGKRQ